MKRFCSALLSVLLMGSLLMGAAHAADDTAENNETKLDIEQYQFQRNGTGGLESFLEDEFVLMPVVGTGATDPQAYTLDGEEGFSVGANALYSSSWGARDDIVFVKNQSPEEGGVACYFRTVIAVASPAGLSQGAEICLVCNNTDYTWSDKPVTAVIADEEFTIYTAVYKKQLAVGEVAPPSLYQLYMPSAATSEDAALFGGAVEVSIVSQAVDVASAEAKNSADPLAGGMELLGEITATSHPFEETSILAQILKGVLEIFT